MKKNAFTLIELLVTISIIAVLSMIGFTRYTSVQSQVRDSVRKSNLRELASVLELYFQQNGKYPLSAQGINCSFCINDYSSGGGQCTGTRFSVEIAPYINRLPHDPLYQADSCGTYNQNYLYTSDCSDGTAIQQQCYRLWAVMENLGNANYPSTQIGGRPAYNYFAIQNP